MTRAEAIETLRANVMVACDTSPKVGYETKLNAEIEKSLKMAIASLKAWDKLNDKLNEDLVKNKPFKQAYIKVQMMINECLKEIDQE